MSELQKKGFSIEVSPAFIEISLDKPDQEKEIKITYKNYSNQNINLRIFPIDFKQKNENGDLTLLGQQTEGYSYSLSSFLSFNSTVLEIDPQGTGTLTVKAKNRQDLSPGGHYAAVIATLSTDAESTGAAKIAPSVSSLILLRKVGGERFNLSLKEVDWPGSLIAFNYPTTVHLLFQNEGNIHMVPYGRIEIRDMFNRLLSKGTINVSSSRVLPESRRRISVDMQSTRKSMPLSVNTLVVSGKDSLKKTTFLYKGTYIYADVTSVIIGFVLCTLLIIFALKRARKKSEKNS